jgi:hypothetical protein
VRRAYFEYLIVDSQFCNLHLGVSQRNPLDFRPVDSKDQYLLIGINADIYIVVVSHTR